MVLLSNAGERAHKTNSRHCCTPKVRARCTAPACWRRSGRGTARACAVPLLLAGAGLRLSACCSCPGQAAAAMLARIGMDRRTAACRKMQAGWVIYTFTPSGSTRPRMSPDSFSTCTAGPGTAFGGDSTGLPLRVLARTESSWSLPGAARDGGGCCLRRMLHSSKDGQCRGRGAPPEEGAPGRPESSWRPPSQTPGWPERGTAQHPPSAQAEASERGRQGEGNH